MAQIVESTFNKEHKDRLFKFVFGQDTDESKRWRLQLYNALHGTSITDADSLKINTIENVIYITMHNDISFLVDTEMSLWEEQSTFNPNMPLRGFLYFAILYQKYLKNNKKNILSEKIVQIPAPRFYVFYHGNENDPKSWKLHLSDAFLKEDKSGDFEWTATILNLQPDKEDVLNKNCLPLYHYVKFVSMISENRKSGMEIHDAIEKAIDKAIEDNFLEGFFERNRAEVIGMILTEFDEADAIKTWRNDGYADGLSQGRQDGEQKKAVEDARKLLADGKYTAEEISRLLQIPTEAFA